MSSELNLDTSYITANQEIVERAWHKLNYLTKPQMSLGMLEHIAAFMCGWQETLTPRTQNAYTLIFAGNHGVVAQGVSAFPATVTAQMVMNFEAGGAAINQLCKAIPSHLIVTPISLETPTHDITIQPAMSMAECCIAFEIGMNAVPKNADIIVIGEMGIGNTTPAAAIAQYLCNGTSSEFVGRGTGIDEAQWHNKCEIVANAIARHQSNIATPLELLSCLGGRELAAMAGAVYQARLQRTPVILDGYVATSAAATLKLTQKTALDHCLAGHCSVEQGHIKLLNLLELAPILNLNMRLGEGSGAQIALSIVRAALACLNGMASFESAGVSNNA